MPTLDAPPTPPGLTRAIVAEIQNNANRNERARLEEAQRALWMYRGNFKMCPVDSSADGYAKEKTPRCTMIMNRIVRVLTDDLYRNAPKRTLPDHPEAGEWLERIYRANCVDSLLQQADRLSMVADVACFQVLPTPDWRRPVRIYLWDASEFCVWCDPEDSARVVAVGILDRYDMQRRIRVWTAEEVLTFLTEKADDGRTAGGTAYALRKAEPNPLGFLPFAFAHFEEPLSEFWTPSIGPFLASCNEQMNTALTENWASIKYNLRPVVVLKSTDFVPPAPIKPGDVWRLKGDGTSLTDAGSEPDAAYLQADSSFVAASWDDFQAYLDHVLEVCGVPKSAIRMEQDATRSGVSIVAEQEPLQKWARSRQRMYQRYEDELARIVLAVGARHLSGQAPEEQGDDFYAEYAATAAGLEAAAYDPRLSLRWPVLRPELSGVEKVQVDAARLEMKTTSRTAIVMADENMTREEADAYLEQIADDLGREQELFGAVEQAQADAALKAAGKHPDQVTEIAKATADKTTESETDDE